MANLLVLDASASECSVALSVNGEVTDTCQSQPRKQTQVLMPMVKSLLTNANVKPSELDGIAFGNGPGSFTGIRIATSLVQGLSLAHDIPVLGISSLQGQAWQAYKTHGWQNVIAIMNAHMGEIFLAAYQIKDDKIECLQPPKVLKLENLAQLQLEDKILADQSWNIAGDGAQFLEQMPQSLQQKIAQCDEQAVPMANTMLQLAEKAWQQDLFTDAEQQQPVYLRDSVSWKKISEQPSLLKK